jgi:hypothetical protein
VSFRDVWVNVDVVRQYSDDVNGTWKNVRLMWQRRSNVRPRYDGTRLILVGLLLL